MLANARDRRRLAQVSSSDFASQTVHVTTDAKARPIITALTMISADRNIFHGERSRGRCEASTVFCASSVTGISSDAWGACVSCCSGGMVGERPGSAGGGAASDAGGAAVTASEGVVVTASGAADGAGDAAVSLAGETGAGISAAGGGGEGGVTAAGSDDAGAASVVSAAGGVDSWATTGTEDAMIIATAAVARTERASQSWSPGTFAERIFMV